MDTTMTEETDIQRLAWRLRGTCQTIHEALECLEIEDAGRVWEDELLDQQTEICVCCQWWFEVCELEFVEEKNGGLCQQCLDDEGISLD